MLCVCADLAWLQEWSGWLKLESVCWPVSCCFEGQAGGYLWCLARYVVSVCVNWPPWLSLLPLFLPQAQPVGPMTICVQFVCAWSLGQFTEQEKVIFFFVWRQIFFFRCPWGTRTDFHCRQSTAFSLQPRLACSSRCIIYCSLLYYACMFLWDHCCIKKIVLIIMHGIKNDYTSSVNEMTILIILLKPTPVGGVYSVSS